MLSPARIQKIKQFLEKLDIPSNDYRLFDEALTHSSYNIEPERDKGYDYERLEFLGDSVLRLSAGEYLFQKYADYDEGKLTKIRSCIVSDKFLAGIALKLGYSRYIDLGCGEERDNGRKKESIRACVFEAILGAIYLSCGFERAKQFVYDVFDGENIKETMHYYNAKEILQEYTQHFNKDLPEYHVISETGPSHDKTFEVSVSYHGKQLAIGSGKTKKEAEQAAARLAVKILKISDE